MIRYGDTLGYLSQHQRRSPAGQKQIDGIRVFLSECPIYAYPQLGFLNAMLPIQVGDLQ